MTKYHILYVEYRKIKNKKKEDYLLTHCLGNMVLVFLWHKHALLEKHKAGLTTPIFYYVIQPTLIGWDQGYDAADTSSHT